MKKGLQQEQEKQAYETPRILASYEKEELEDSIGLAPEVQGNNDTGCGCGCGCGG